jgi:hypothetical protein
MNIETPTTALTLSERNQRAAQMRLRGIDCQTIAETLGIALSTVYVAVDSAMKEVPFADADSLRKIELAHLDKAQSKALEILDKQHVAISASGKVVYTESGEPVLDDSVALKAVDSLVKVQGRRAKLLGLDAPTRVQAMIGIITLDEQKLDITNLFERLKPRELVEG